MIGRVETGVGRTDGVTGADGARSDDGLAGAARLAAIALGAPAALITIEGADGRLRVAAFAWPSDGKEPDASPWQWALDSRSGLVVEDLHRDPRFADQVFTRAHPRYRFYAGVPVGCGVAGARHDAAAAVRGTISVIDDRPRRLGADQLESLQALATLIANALPGRHGPYGADLHGERQLLRAMLDVCPDLIYFKDRASRFLKVSRSLAERAGYASPEDMVGKTDADIFSNEHADVAREDERRVMDGGPAVIGKTEREVWADGRVRYVTTSKIAWRDRDGAVVGLFGVSRDITEPRKLEMELHQAQKLESIGRLAAGVAHEINTPVQFVSDSVHFVKDAVGDLAGLIAQYQAVQRRIEAGEAALEAVRETRAAEEAADLPYLLEQLPKALARSLDGLDRVATIVRSMKEFAHPDQKEMTLVDLNQAVRSTLTIARNEYKYLADVETDLGLLPLVRCHGGEMNQAMLNVVINAAHAIEDVVRGTERRGRIVVRSWQDGAFVAIAISDTGAGIPRDVQDRMFDPFFTTKDLGRGTGQGLAIARAVVVEKHGGELTFETREGEGTTFFLRLPIQPAGRSL